MIGLVANLGTVGQGHDRDAERYSTCRTPAGGVLDRIGGAPQPEQFVESNIVRVNPHGARVLPHGSAFDQPSLDILGIAQVGDHSEVGTVD